MSESTGRPTIRDVAARAGVSKSLVSLVLQGGHNVGPERLRAVEQAIAELGFRPNESARSLSQSRTHTAGLLLNDMRNPWFVDLVEAAVAVLHDAGLFPLLADSHLEQRAGRDPAEVFLNQRIEGLLVVGTTAEPSVVREVAERIPTVLAGTREPTVTSADVVVNDDEVGGRLATEHLLTLGHRRITLLEAPGIVGALRRRGYEQAMSAAGLGRLVTVESGDSTEAGGYEAGLRILRSEDRPTALVAYNDVSAVGVLSAATEFGLDVPRDVSIVGYDDTYLARIRHIGLTSVDNRNADVGRIAAEFLAARIADPGGEARLETVTPAVIVRRSSGRPPS